MPYKLLVMGVSGCGKSTLAAQWGLALGATLIEGDDHHPAANQDKMRQGIALDDADRTPWLRHLGTLLADADEGAVMTCSALKRSYRDLFRSAVPSLAIVFIDITPAQARARVAERQEHLFPASLVQSQFEALEPPLGEPGVLRVDAAQPLTVQLEEILRWLGQNAAQTNPPLKENQP
ncbi:MAG: gluconokinase [Burkholderiaceae bacterium]